MTLRKLRLDQALLVIPLWHFVWIAVALSTLLSLVMSQLIHGHLTWHYPVTASLISLVVASLVIALIQRLRSQLVDREARLRAILDHSPAMIFLKDLDGRYLNANRQFLETFHFSRQDVIGKTDAELFPAAQAAVFRANDLRVLEVQQPLEFEEVAQHDDGPHTSIVLKYPVYASAGIPYATGGIATDITERKKAERALREAHQTLKSVRDEREQLAQALHDNILQMFYATGLLLEVGQGEVRSNPERVEDRIRTAIVQLRTIMEDVRSYITGSDLPRLQAADLEASLRQLIATLARTGLMRLELEMDPHVLPYLLPSAIPHLYYITEEALSNSLRHSQGQRALVSLRLHEDRVCLKIEDDGQGFAVSAGLRSGRGLSNMQARAEKLGGTLRVEAVPGRGTQVRLDIPIRASRVTPSPDSRSHLEGGS